jgi:hypothetical protein
MRLRSFVIIGTLWAANAGCGEEFLGNAVRNTAEAPTRALDEHHLDKRCCRWAREAWDQLCRDNPDQVYSPDFRDGFVCGYADFLTRGGKGNPPSVPPFRYQLFNKYNEPGASNTAALEWFAGFRVGAVEARESGLRDAIVIPLASPPINAIDRRAMREEDHAASQLDGAPQLPEELPAPKRLP